jgi:hypothetical protein
MDNTTSSLSRTSRGITFKFTTVENERITCSLPTTSWESNDVVLCNCDIQIDSLILTDRVSGCVIGSYTYNREDAAGMIPAYTMHDLLINGWGFDQNDEEGRFTISVEDFLACYEKDITDEVREFLRDLIDAD